MAKRPSKQTAKAEPALTTRALDHGEAASGAASLRAGFCFTSHDDLAFALGFPHFKYLTEDTEDPRAEAERLLIHGYPYQHVAYPRKAVERLLRALALPVAFDLTPDAVVLRPEAVAALDRSEPMTEGEALSILSSILTKDCPPPSAPVMHLLCEAMFGPDKVSSAILKALESIRTELWISYGHVLQESIDVLALMSLRLTSAGQDQTLSALRDLQSKVLERAKQGFDVTAAERDLATSPNSVVPVVDGRSDPVAWRAEMLRRKALKQHVDLVRGGANGCGFDVANQTDIVTPPRPVFRASAEAVKAARLKRKDEPWYSLPDPRLVFLGGDDVYRVERDLWSRAQTPTPPAEAQAIILERFGRIRSPVTVELALDMAAKSRAKAAAKAWLLAHLDDARPVLDGLAKGSSRLAKDAKDFLGKLPS